MRKIMLGGTGGVLIPAAAFGHAGEQGFVLLLPTQIYSLAGGATVALTLLLLAVVPGRFAQLPFRAMPLLRVPGRPALRRASSLAVSLLLGWLVWRGATGPGDPAVNPLPMTVWVLFWIALVTLQGLLGDLWRWLNPWTGPGAVLRRVTGRRAPLRYPRGLGHAPGLLGFLAFAGFLLADPAPTDPGRLAVAVALYWAAMMVGLMLFGPVWLVRGEALTILMRAYARVAAIGRSGGRLALGLPGWRMLAGPGMGAGLALFCLLLLGSGSFDGFNETFLWLSLLGINPLEFPGRSAVIGANLAGLVLANAALVAVFCGTLGLGARLAGDKAPLRDLLCRFAPTILPIALAYHIAHYLTVFLVDGQYVLAALARLAGLPEFHVSAGFLSTPGPVRLIWFTQAGAVVAGHVIAILLAHALAMRAGQDRRRALLGQAPLALFMIAYTVFGLWLLATPRGA